MEYALATLLLMAVAAVIAHPLFRPSTEPLADPIGHLAELRSLTDRKLAIYGSIRDLGFDLQTDKLTEDDYSETVAALKAEAVDVVARIEELTEDVPRGSDSIERRIAEARADRAPGSVATSRGPARQARPAAGEAGDAAAFCTQCGHPRRVDDRFCGGCGCPLGAS